MVLNVAAILFVAFIILKVTGLAALPWIWVFSPLWVPLAFMTGVFLCCFIYVVVSESINRWLKHP